MERCWLLHEEKWDLVDLNFESFLLPDVDFDRREAG
jgi:hypothetical protein